jgi:riboflavin synthase
VKLDQIFIGNMFTGIIEGLGKISEIIRSGQGLRLSVDASFELDHTKIGDSIAVNGACLTVVKISGTRFSADVSAETLEITTFNNARIGDQVNLERALRLSERIDGHLVSGHVDGTAVIRSKKNLSNAVIIGFELSSMIARHMIQKGSVAVDGISLTINSCGQNSFEVAIIPHTARMTTIHSKRIGDKVNIETDMIGKYVEKYVSGKHSADPSSKTSSLIDREYLIKKGFI